MVVYRIVEMVHRKVEVVVVNNKISVKLLNVACVKNYLTIKIIMVIIVVAFQKLIDVNSHMGDEIGKLIMQPIVKDEEMDVGSNLVG